MRKYIIMICMFALLPLLTSAQTNTSAPDSANGNAKWTFTVNADGTATLTDITGLPANSTLYIPATVTDGITGISYNVSVLGDPTTVITSIDNAFGYDAVMPGRPENNPNNAAITAVNFDNAVNLTTISTAAFNTGSSDTSTDKPHQLTQTNLDFSKCVKLTYIGANAFHCQLGLTGTLTLPASLRAIKGGDTYGAFRYTAFSTIVIEGADDNTSQLNDIGLDAFSAMPNLTGDVVIPSGVNVIDDGIFRNDPLLRSVTFKTTSPINFINTRGAAAYGSFASCQSLEFIDMSRSEGIVSTTPVTFLDRSTIAAGGAYPFYNLPAHTVVYLPQDKVYEYDASLFEFEVTQPSVAAYTDVSSGAFSITSLFNGSAQAWTVDGYSTDGGLTYTSTSPEWLTFAEGVGGSATLTTNDKDVILSGRNKALQQSAPVVDYDLSTKGGTTPMNTANTYVISAPGTYKFPLVYGNGIVNGAENSSAWSSNAAANSETFLANFVDNTNTIGGKATDGLITSASISEQGHTATSAEIVWADNSGLINASTFSLSSATVDGINMQYVSFNVPNTITSGNAVIAVKDAGGNVLWSWNLWFAPQSALGTIPVKNFTDQSYNFSAEPLGYIPSEGAPERSVIVKVRQGISGLTRDITITQEGYESTSGGSYMLFQYGRNAAFRFGDNATMTTNSVPSSSITSPMGKLISTPETFYNTAQNKYACTNIYRNLWSMNNTQEVFDDAPVVKTIYDPSPVGFHIPSGNAFTGFASADPYLAGIGNSLYSPVNAKGEFHNGWDFYTDKTKTSTIFFPVWGYGDCGGSIGWSTGLSGYWSTGIALNNPTYYVGCLLLRKAPSTPNTAEFLGTYNRLHTFAVRPVAE